jgi:hypothetical protein
MTERVSESDLDFLESLSTYVGPIDGSVLKRLVGEVRRLRRILDGRCRRPAGARTRSRRWNARSWLSGMSRFGDEQPRG